MSRHNSTVPDGASASQRVTPPPQSGPITDHVKVYNPQLYRELLGASDWSETIEKARKAKRVALLAQHNDEERAAIARRAEQERRAKEERDAVAAERRRQMLAEREERELHAFKERTRHFFAQHETLLNQLCEIEYDAAAHEARVRERLYREWEREVFLPIQTQVNREIENRAAYDLKVKLQNNAATTTTTTSAAAAHSPRTSLRLNDPDVVLHASTAGWTAASGGKESTLPKVTRSLETTHDAALAGTWAARKEVMWRAFLEEDNRRRRGHEKSGVFLSDDTLSYDPARQRDATAIRYRVPKPGSAPASGGANAALAAFASTSAAGDGGYLVSSVDQSRRTARDIESQYAALAQQYLMNERDSRSGKLAGMAGGVDDQSTTRRVTQTAAEGLSQHARHGTGRAAARGMSPPVYRHDDVRIPYRLPPGPGRRESTIVEATLRELVPRTHMPYDLDNNATTTVRSNNNNNGNNGSSSGRHARRTQGCSSRSPGRNDAASASAPLITPEARHELIASYAGASAHKHNMNRAAERHVGAVVDEVQTRWTQTLSGTAPNQLKDFQARQHQQRLADSFVPVSGGFEEAPSAERRLEVGRGGAPARAMPLPLPGGMAERADRDVRGEAVWARDRLARDAYLPTREWGSDRLPSTVYGHNVQPDGSAQVPSDRKVAEGYMKSETTTVLFDHFDYPKGMQSQHFGKRMEVWRQI